MFLTFTVLPLSVVILCLLRAMLLCCIQDSAAHKRCRHPLSTLHGYDCLMPAAVAANAYMIKQFTRLFLYRICPVNPNRQPSEHMPPTATAT